MSETFAAVLEHARGWYDQAQAGGWLDASDRAALAAAEEGAAADLFVDQQARPLVVALFGGTGVGKSSLLNRIARAPVARTGAERPTSREVTVYLHEDVKLASLPPNLPLGPERVVRHESGAQRDVLWIDAPDINSTEERNRACALAWLPHVDLVCYVVSPERYRDDAGWRQLLARGQKHGWLFVLNRWDEGDSIQGEDFADMLREAGFDAPLLVRTCCLPGRELPSPDEFEQIELALRALLEAHGVRELTRLGQRARLQALRRALQSAQRRFGSEDTWRKLRDAASQNWQAAAATILSGAEWSVRTLATRFAAQAGGLWHSVRKHVLSSGREPPDKPDQSDEGQADQIADGARRLWDAWSQSRLTSWLDSTEVAVRRAGVSAEPARRHLEQAAAAAGECVAQHVTDQLHHALAKPGTLLQRVARRITGFLMVLLPTLAMLWVAWVVVRGFHAAAEGRAPFLGTSFVVHSVFQIVLAWAIPFTIDRLLKPSIEHSAMRGMRRGLEIALDEIGERLTDTLKALDEQAATNRESSQAILDRVAAALMRSIDARTPALGRLLARPKSDRLP